MKKDYPFRDRVRELRAEGKKPTEILTVLRKEGLKTSRGNLPTLNNITMTDYKRDHGAKKVRSKIFKEKEEVASIEVPETPMEFAWTSKNSLKVALVFTTPDGAMKLIRDYLEAA